MPIYAPGKRDPRNRAVRHRRGIDAALSLTPMVDMFTILVVFLLNNYNETKEILLLPKDVELPKASQVKELKPAHLVTLTTDEVILDKEPVAKLKDVQAQKDWLVPALREKLAALIAADEAKAKAAISTTLKGALPVAGAPEPPKEDAEDRKRITVQADKQMDFLTIKKIMYTVTEAGAHEINFAVSKLEKPIKEE